MLAGMYAVRNMVLGEKTDLWSVNADQEYHEEVKSGKAVPGGGRNARRVEIEEQEAEAALEAELAVVFSRFDRVAAGISSAVILGGLIFLMTVILLGKGPTGGPVGANLQLLGQYFPGYQVSGLGALIGLGYGAVFGFIIGYLFALFTNVATTVYKMILARKAAVYNMWNVFDYI